MFPDINFFSMCAGGGGGGGGSAKAVRSEINIKRLCYKITIQHSVLYFR